MVDKENKNPLDTYITIGTIICVAFIGVMVGGIIGYMVGGSVIGVSIGIIFSYLMKLKNSSH